MLINDYQEILDDDGYALLHGVNGIEEYLNKTKLTSTLLYHFCYYVDSFFDELKPESSTHDLPVVLLARLSDLLRDYEFYQGYFDAPKAWGEFFNDLCSITYDEDPEYNLRHALYRLGQATFCKNKRLEYLAKTGSTYTSAHDREVIDLLRLLIQDRIYRFAIPQSKLNNLNRQFEDRKHTFRNQRWALMLEFRTQADDAMIESFSIFRASLPNFRLYRDYIREVTDERFYAAKPDMKIPSSVLRSLDYLFQNAFIFTKREIGFPNTHSQHKHNVMVGRYCDAEIRLRNLKLMANLLFAYEHYLSGQMPKNHDIMDLLIRLQDILFGASEIFTASPLCINNFHLALKRCCNKAEEEVALDLKHLLQDDDPKVLEQYISLRRAAIHALTQSIEFYDTLERQKLLDHLTRERIMICVAQFSARASFRASAVLSRLYLIKKCQHPFINEAVMRKVQADSIALYVQSKPHFDFGQIPDLDKQSIQGDEVFYVRSFCMLSQDLQRVLMRARRLYATEEMRDFITGPDQLGRMYNVPLPVIKNVVEEKNREEGATSASLDYAEPVIDCAAAKPFQNRTSSSFNLTASLCGLMVTLFMLFYEKDDLTAIGFKVSCLSYLSATIMQFHQFTSEQLNRENIRAHFSRVITQMVALVAHTTLALLIVNKFLEEFISPSAQQDSQFKV